MWHYCIQKVTEKYFQISIWWLIVIVCQEPEAVKVTLKSNGKEALSMNVLKKVTAMERQARILFKKEIATKH